MLEHLSTRNHGLCPHQLQLSAETKDSAINGITLLWDARMRARWAWMLGLRCQSVSSLASADKTLMPEWAALSLFLCMWQYDLATGIRDRNGNGLSFPVIGNCCSERRKKGSKVEAKVHSYYKCHLFKYQDHWKGILFIFLLLKN